MHSTGLKNGIWPPLLQSPLLMLWKKKIICITKERRGNTVPFLSAPAFPIQRSGKKLNNGDSCSMAYIAFIGSLKREEGTRAHKQNPPFTTQQTFQCLKEYQEESRAHQTNELSFSLSRLGHQHRLRHTCKAKCWNCNAVAIKGTTRDYSLILVALPINRMLIMKCSHIRLTLLVSLVSWPKALK